MGTLEVLTAPRSPWQNPYAERFIGSLRRECLDHIIIFNESSLKRILKAYFEYYEHSRNHLSLEKDAPASRTVQHPELGRVVALPQVGGLHHRDERRAA
jgi:transposase InsO family protein